jgi:hypothetical protein
MEENIFEAYGSWDVGPGTVSGWTLGHDFAERGDVERWYTSLENVKADNVEHDAM